MKTSFFETDHVDPDRDLSIDRQIKLKNNILHIRQEGQYGMWYINFDKGQIPERLKGAYLSAQEAERVARLYLVSKGREELGA